MGSDTVIEGSAEEWARGLESFLPDGTETPAVYATAILGASMPGPGNARAAFRLIGGGRATALVVSSYATVPETRTGSAVVAARIAELEKSCDGTAITCDPRVETSSGPVIVRRWGDGSHVAASSVRGNGVVVTVESWNGDADKNRILDGSGDPGLLGDMDTLVTLAASVPLPALLVTTPAPIPTLETTAPDPTPPPTSEPAPTPTPKPAGLFGAYASEACEQVMTYEYRIPRPITGAVIQYVVCPYEDGGTLVPYPVTPDQPGVFEDLDAALRQPGEARSGGCFMVLRLIRPVFVQTADGWFRVQVPEDRCGNPQQQSLDAVAAVVGST